MDDSEQQLPLLAQLGGGITPDDQESNTVAACLPRATLQTAVTVVHDVASRTKIKSKQLKLERAKEIAAPECWPANGSRGRRAGRGPPPPNPIPSPVPNPLPDLGFEQD